MKYKHKWESEKERKAYIEEDSHDSFGIGA